MNQDLEKELRHALRRKQPSRDLIPRVRASMWRFAAAAGILIALGAPAGVLQYRAWQHRKAKDQLVFAFHLASGKLQLTQQRLRIAK